MAGILQTFNNISYSKEKEGGCKVKLSIEIANERFESIKNKVYERLAPTVNIQGFRPGKAPKNLIVANLGPSLYEQTINELIPECTLEVIRKENLIPLDQISYRLEKVAEGTGLKYTATFSVFPEFELPDLKKLNAKRKEYKVDDKEVDDVISQMYKDKSKVDTKDSGQKAEKAVDLTKLDDNWVKTLNIGVKNFNELKIKIRKELEKQKKLIEDNRFIKEIIDEIYDKTKFEIPSTLIDQEIIRRELEYKGRIEKLGMKLEDFLTSQKTNLEELKKSWKKDAEDKLKTEIILMKIANVYKIIVEEKEVEDQINTIKDEKIKASYNTNESKSYLRSLLTRQKVVNKVFELVK